MKFYFIYTFYKGKEVIKMSLFKEWEELLSEMTKTDYDKVYPIIEALDQENAIEHFEDISSEFQALQKEWKTKFYNEEIMNRILRKIEIIETKINQSKGLRLTKWEQFELLAREKEWEPIIKLINKMNALEVESKRHLESKQIEDLNSDFKKLLPYITTDIGVGYKWLIIREFEKRFRVYQKREERQVTTDFGNWLRSTRKQKGLSLKKLEELSGVSGAYIFRIEKGTRKTPSIPITEKLAVALGVPPKELLQMIGHSIDKENENVPELNQLVILNDYTINGHMLTTEQKNKIAKLIDKMFKEDWDDEALWYKGTELFNVFVPLNKELSNND